MRCGNCCSGEPGTIAVKDSDIETLGKYLGLPQEAFREVYVRVLPDGTASLREKANGDCIFFNNGSECSIYDHRPRQCRTWPFWQSMVQSPESWEKEAKSCAGMNRGPLFSADFIRKTSRNDGTYGSILRNRAGKGG
jgi:hypothetical protein